MNEIKNVEISSEVFERLLKEKKAMEERENQREEEQKRKKEEIRLEGYNDGLKHFDNPSLNYETIIKLKRIMFPKISFRPPSGEDSERTQVEKILQSKIALVKDWGREFEYYEGWKQAFSDKYEAFEKEEALKKKLEAEDQQN